MTNDKLTQDEIIKLWTDALRSGKYKQGRVKLYNTKDDTYCCLGVLCRVYEENVGKVLPEIERKALLNNELEVVKDWVNLIYSDGDYGLGNSLASLNDTKCFTFNQIADIIESKPEGLFFDKLVVGKGV